MKENSTIAATITEEEQRRYEELQMMALDMARAGETIELQKMLEAGMPVNLADEKGNSLLMLASYNENPETTAMLIRLGAEIDERNDRGQTPLGGMAFKGNVEIARMLIDAGADLQANNGSGMTPLHYAKMFGRHKVAELLESRGANYLATVQGDAKSSSGGLALRIAEFFIKIRELFGTGSKKARS